jgi:hypothetical protein
MQHIHDLAARLRLALIISETLATDEQEVLFLRVMSVFIHSSRTLRDIP